MHSRELGYRFSRQSAAGPLTGDCLTRRPRLGKRIVGEESDEGRVEAYFGLSPVLLPILHSAADIARYRARLSGPLADRIDMHVALAPVPIRALSDHRAGERSATIRARVEMARKRQRRRYAGQRGVRCNAHASGRALDATGRAEPDARALLHDAAERVNLSARGYHRALKLARTIADLADRDVVGKTDVAEALRYRPRVEVHEARGAPA